MSGTLPNFDFDESVESNELDLKVFFAENGSSSAFTYTKPATPTISNAVAAARAAIIAAGGQEFGALAEAFKFERKKGNNPTNYKTPKATEADLKLRNCTVANYKGADLIDGKRLDAYVLDEANAKLKIYKSLKVEITETDENTKDGEIGVKLTNNTASTARVVYDLITGTSTLTP